MDSEGEASAAAECDVLFDEADVLVLDKPPGLDMVELVRAVRDAWDHEPGFPQVMGRLDRPTSGLVVCVLSRPALEALTPWSVTKEYLAIVEGELRGAGVIDVPLAARSERLKGSGRVQEAKTSWRALDANQRASLLVATLHTGRTHQIRRHMKAVQHPVVGDDRYGRGRERGRGRDERGDLMLHAWRVTHDGSVPIVPRVLEAPMPPRMRDACARLRLRT